MRLVRFVSLFVVLSAVATASNNTLPRSVSDDVRNAIDKADSALTSGERQLALALYEGSLYPDGIKLAVDESTVTSDAQFRGVSQALDVWRNELGGDFPVELVYNEDEADVVVKFVETIEDRGTDTLGLIKLQKSFRWSSTKREVSFKGTISIVRSAPGGRLTQAEVRDVAMHEIGHLLGLADTAQHGVLMGPMERGKPLTKPTTQETDDVKSIRKLLRQKLQSAGAQ